MAFNILNLEAVGGQSRRGRTVQKYVYRTADTYATVIAANYFSDIKDKLEVGDIIDVEIVTFAADNITVTAKSGGFTMKVGVSTSALFYVHPVASEENELLITSLTDISTASNVSLTANMAGDIVGITTVLAGVITVGDAAITFTNGGVAIENSAITVANAGSAVGTVDTSSPSGVRTIAATSAIVMLSDGGSTGTQILYVVYEVAPSVGGAAGKVQVHTSMLDCSAASSVWAIAPKAGTIVKCWTVINNAITVGDAAITFELGGTAITGAGITIANAGSAAGTVDSSVPTALNVVTEGQAIECITDGGSTDACITQIYIDIE